MTYRNDYANMAPWQSVPEEAFASCIQQTCPLLYRGAIYKCSTAGLLPDTLKRFNFPNIEQWQSYIPEALLPTDSYDRVVEFVDNFGKPNAICGQCPSAGRGMIDHQTNIYD